MPTVPTTSFFFNTRTNDYTQPTSRKQAWQLVSTICRDVGLRGNYGTHSLRKTWGYHARMNGVDLALIMHKLNHSNLAYTKRYLGITDEELAWLDRFVGANTVARVGPVGEVVKSQVLEIAID